MQKDLWKKFRAIVPAVDNSYPFFTATTPMEINKYMADLMFDIKNSMYVGVNTELSQSISNNIFKLLTALAKLENHYKLPASIAFTHPMMTGRTLNVSGTFDAVVSMIKDLAEFMLSSDFYGLQSVINSLLGEILHIADNYQINVSELVLFKLDIVSEKPADDKFTTMQIARAEQVKINNLNEFLIDLKFNAEGEYIKILIPEAYTEQFAERKEYGNIILDYFSLAQIYKKLENELKLALNYTAKAREYLVNNNYMVGFLQNDQLIDSSTVINFGELSTALPIIFNSHTNTFGKFLDYIHNEKQQIN